MKQSPYSAPTFTAYQWFLIVIQALLQFTVILEFIALSTLGEIFMKSLAIDSSTFGIVISS